MSDWTKPSSRQAPRRPADTLIGWKSRAVAALVAPPIFCISLWIVSFPFRFVGIVLAAKYMTVVGLVSAAVGAYIDLERLPNLLGNVFLTNRGDERNYWVFATYWVTVVIVDLIAARLS
jgi:hypothetical protein